MRFNHQRTVVTAVGSAFVAALCTLSTVSGGDWSHWRGPAHDGTSDEVGLISTWSQDGENLIWRADFTGRSTPVVFDGRVCANGRAAEGVERQEMVACFDAASGEKLWEHRFNVFHTSVPWNRVGWGNPTIDPETGYLYVQGVGGWFHCLDSKDGRVIWAKRFVEEFGFMEGYGGRTQTPTIDEDRVLITFSNTSWGSETRPLHRMRAFDKLTGELIWVSSPAPSQADKNTQSTPVVAVIDGRRLVIAGNGGGGIYAVEARTGRPVWGFQLSKRGINTSVLVHGSIVYASHSEENVDGGPMGRVVAIDATGSGDVTSTHEIWRAPLGVGFSSPTLENGRLYVVDNKADLHVLNASTGEEIWQMDIGRVGKASPVAADGKIYLTEVNGKFIIIEPGDESGRILDQEEITIPGRTSAEIYGSVAIAEGRIYFTTDEGIYCLGSKDPPSRTTVSKPMKLVESAPSPGTTVAHIALVPAETWVRPGESVDFELRAFDDKGRQLDSLPATWSLEGLHGEIDNGRFTAKATANSAAGVVSAAVGELSGSARVRVLQDLPFREDFESTEIGSRPSYQMAYPFAFKVEEQDGTNVLSKGPSPRKIHRHITFLGHSEHANYTIEADLKGTKTGRRVSDLGLINSGYTMELLGAHQRLQIRSWQSGLRMMHEIDFTWEPGAWYHMKFKVSQDADKGVLQGKVWRRDSEEPEDWTITTEDPLPITSGAPGLSGYSPSPLYFDNILVSNN